MKQNNKTMKINIDPIELENKILKILDQHESVTYPNGVGSTFYCIKSNSHRSIAKEIIKSIINK